MENIRTKGNKILLFIIAIALVFSFTSLVFATEIVDPEDEEVVLPGEVGDVQNPTKEAGQLTNQGDVKLTKTVAATEEEGVYSITLTAQGVNNVVTTTTEVPVYVVVVLDRSGSMSGTRWTNAVSGAKTFATNLLSKYPNAQLALVTFASDSTVNRNFANQNFSSTSFGSASGGTYLGSAANMATNLLKNAKANNANAKLYMVILSDGDVSDGVSAVTTAKSQGIEVFTVGYEVSSSDATTLKSIATDASHYIDASTSNIASSLNKIANSIQVQVEVPAGKNAVITDVLGDGFEFVEDSASSNATVEDKKISFSIGDVTKVATTVSFKIKVINKDLPTGWHKTNNIAEIEYTNLEAKSVDVVIDESSEIYWEQETYTYKVNYKEKETGKEIAPEKEVSDAICGKEYTENAIEIVGYKLIGEKTQEVVEDSEDKTVTFYYAKKNNLDYIVDYFKDGIKISADADNTFDNMTFEQIISEEDIDVDKYLPKGYKAAITTDMPYSIIDGENRISVSYTKRNDLSYRVEYYYDGVLDDSKTVYFENMEFGTIVSEYESKLSNGYEFVNDSGSITIDDEQENVIKVYYKAIEEPAPKTGTTIEKNNSNALFVSIIVLVSLMGIALITKKILIKKI